MTRQSQLFRIKKLEAVRAPGHRHQPSVRILPGEDISERIAEARAECQRHGCDRMLIAIPAPVSPENWDEAVNAELALLDERHVFE